MNFKNNFDKVEFSYVLTLWDDKLFYLEILFKQQTVDIGVTNFLVHFANENKIIYFQFFNVQTSLKMITFEKKIQTWKKLTSHLFSTMNYLKVIKMADFSSSFILSFSNEVFAIRGRRLK